MSKNWKKRALGLNLNVECLEDRWVPAGNIRAIVDGGVLRIRSDNDDFHAFSISGTGRDSVIIRPSVGTTINGQSGNVALRRITEGFDIQTGNGSDSIVISGVDGRDYLSIVTNGGDDFVHIVHDTRSLHSTWVRTGDGDDTIIVNGSTFREHFAIVGGEGNDRVDVGPRNRFSGNVSFDGSGGTNTLNQTGNDFRQTPRFLNFSSTSAARPPIAANDTGTVAQTQQIAISVLANDTAVDGTLTPSSVTITSQPSNGTASVNSDGTISYKAGSTGSSDTFRYTVKNSGGATSNEATVSITITDGVGPVPTLTSTTKDQTNTTPIPITLDFNENVTGLEKSDFSVSGGTLSDITTVSAKQYTFSVTPSGQGAVTVSLPSGKVTDAANNTNSASNSFSRSFDTTAPTITANSKTTNDTTPTLTGTVNDTTSTVVVTVNGQTTTATINGGTWSATLATALAEGKYSIVATATDPAGNVGTANLADGLVIDTTSPTIVVSSSLTSPTNSTSIPVTFTFSEDVTGFAGDLVTVTNGTLGGFTATNAKVYTATITPTASGVVGVTVPAGKATDTAGNLSVVSNAFQITFDGSIPSVTLSSSTTSPTRTSPIPVTASFSENVTGFDISDISVTNGTAGNFVTVDAKTYTFSITPTAQGTVTVNIAAGAAKDADNNATTAASPLTRVFDSIAPGTTLPQVFSNSKTPTVTGVSTEDGTSVVVTSNGKSVNAVVTGTNWTATFTDEFLDGVYGMTAIVSDAAGNANPITFAGGLIVDTTPPSIQILSPEASPTSAASIPIEVTFTEVVTGFTASDVFVGNGSLLNFTDLGDGQSFTFEITPTIDGTVNVKIADGAVVDQAGNTNLVATFSIVSSRFAPVPTISTTANDPSNASPIPFTVTFSEGVTGFALADVGVANGTASNFVAVSATKYTFDVAPTADGTVTVSIAAAAAKDAQNTESVAATDVSVVSDRTAPVPTISTTSASPTGTTPIPYTVTFSENVTGFLAEDVGVANGTLSNFTAVNGKEYSFTVSPTADGDVIVSVAAAGARDAAGNNNTAATPVTVVFSAPPTGTITTNITNPSNLAAIPFTITFNKDVTGFELSDLVVVNGTAQNFQTVNSKEYTFDVAPTVDGDVTVSVPANAAIDAASIGNAAVAPVTVVSDRTVPTATISTTASDPSALATFPFTVTFSESVIDFTAADVGVANGSLTNFVTVSGTQYTFDVTPAADGAVTVSVAAAVAKDAAGNDSKAATNVSIVSDRTGPTTTVSSTSANPTGAALIPFTVTFGEDASDFVIGDITVVNGTAQDFMKVTATTYTFNVAPTADGDVTVSVAAGVATDVLGNSNTAGAGVTVVSDRTGPTTVLSTTAANPTKAATLPFTVVFGGAVTDFVLGDITISNGTASNLQTTDNITFTFDVTPSGDGTVTVGIAAGVALDSLGNSNLAATDFNLVSDQTAPTGTVDATSTGTVTGTTADATTSVTRVQVAIFNGTGWWDGTAFSSAVEIYFDATSANGFATWSFTIPAGTYTVQARLTDAVGNVNDLTANNVVVS